ncbi:hypothetical protein HHX47_DHR2001155 [Lentinula edodes]|nr:hypothetical protein HHX47_DHR2001155 [Lentinula edodes]
MPPVMLTLLHFQGTETTQTFRYQPGIASRLHSSRVAVLAVANRVLHFQAGVVRSVDQMEGIKDDISPTKRQKMSKISGSQIYSEEECNAMHPVNYNIKPEWKFDGKIVTVPDLPFNLLASTLREGFIQHISSTVNVSRIRLLYAGKLITNNSTIASYNTEDKELVTLILGDAKKN